MGCGKKQPQINIPAAPKLPTADEIFAAATKYAGQNYPLAFGSREGALKDIQTPESALAYYNSFQPTSFEQALGNQYYQNVFPKASEAIKAGLSLSGTANSPILAEQLGLLSGRLGVDIGNQLSDVANTRAYNTLASRLGIDPNSLTNPFVESSLQQSQGQGELDYQTAMSQAMADYNNQINKYNNRSGFIGSLGSLLGGGIGLIGGQKGAAIGAGLGGAASSLFGGSSPIDLGTAFLASQSLPGRQQTQQNPFDLRAPGVGGDIAQNENVMSLFSQPGSMGSSFADPGVYNPAIARARTQNPFQFNPFLY